MTSQPQLSLPQHGSCQCGAVTYVLNAQPLGLWTCHCTECQRQTGSAFGMSMPVPSDGLRFTGVEPARWYRRAESGRRVEALFCARCGSRIAHRHEGRDGVTTLKPGTLLDTSGLAPLRHHFRDTAQPWIDALLPQDAS
jgi:hypothetical protein